jgi:glycosyltransferase involved in cell wall biosynthesis
MTRLSVVVPVYNEEATVEALVADLEREIVPLTDDVEAIVVDDASTDGSPALLDRLASDRPWLHVEHAARNAGHGPSVARGLDRATGEWIVQLDSDGQFVVAEMRALWEQRDRADLLLGVRRSRQDPTHRLVLSRVVRLAVLLIAGRPLRDANVPFRLFRREVWEDVRRAVPEPPLAPSIFLAVGAGVRGWRIAEMPVTHLPRERGVSSLRQLRLVLFSLRGLAQLLRFRRALGALPPREGTPG